MPGKGKGRQPVSKRKRMSDLPSPQGTPTTKKAKNAGSKKQPNFAADGGGVVRKPSKQGQKETHGQIMTGKYMKLGDTGMTLIMKIEPGQLYNPVVSADSRGGMKVSTGPRTHGTYCLFMFLCMFISDTLPLLFCVSPQVLSVM